MRGYDRPRVTSAWQGRSDLNSVFRLYVLPMLLVERLRPEHELVCLVHIGQSDVTPSLALAEQISSAEWRDDAFEVAWKDGRTLSVPPL